MAHHGSHNQGFARSERVAEQIRRELAALIRDRVKDPRVGPVTVLDVQVSKDLAHAKIWFDVQEQTHGLEAQEALKHASGFLRRELGHLMKLRIAPDLHFFYDDTQQKGMVLSALIDKAIASDRENHHDDDEVVAVAEGSAQP